MIWLDWKLFGNGHGMASPFWDDTFYWLVDTLRCDRGHGKGRFYRTFGGLGAQLSSVEWFTPRPGTRRRLFGREFVIFNTRRNWLRVYCCWALADGVRDFTEVRNLERELQTWGHGA